MATSYDNYNKALSDAWVNRKKNLDPLGRKLVGTDVKYDCVKASMGVMINSDTGYSSKKKK